MTAPPDDLTARLTTIAGGDEVRTTRAEPRLETTA